MVYRFRKCNEYNYLDVVLDRITLASPNTFNDPYDSTLLYNNFVSYDENPEAYNEALFGKWNPKLNSVFDKAVSSTFRDTIRIACFSEVIDEEIMWAHYAASATGFAIGYKYENLSDFANTNKDMYLTPIIYNDKKIKKISDDDEQLLEQMYKSVPKLKKEVWSYEKECRLVTKRKNKGEPEYKTYTNLKADALYLGEYISDFNKILICSIALKKKIKVYEMETQFSDTYRKLVVRELTAEEIDRYSKHFVIKL
jgi:hypothetical protein